MLLALGAAVFQESPADIFKKVEERALSSRAFSIKSRIEIKGTRDGMATEAELNGTFRSKGEGLAAVEISGTMNGKPFQVTMVSDGKKARYEAGGQTGTAEHRLPLGRIARQLHVRAGLFGSAGAIVQTILQPGLEWNKLFIATDITAKADEKVGDRSCKVLVFNLPSAAPGAPALKCKLWIDAERWVPVKRETTSSGDRESATIMETYTDIVRDGEIADDVFRIDK